MAFFFTHAAQLLTLAGPDRARRGQEMSDPGIVPDGAVLINDGRILRAGPTDKVARDLPSEIGTLEEIDCRGKLLTPGLIDSHTHLVFAGSRLEDYERRLRGESYEQIVAAGGGIATTVAAVRAAGADQLYELALPRLLRARSLGTTTLEIKTGYGLEMAAEHRTLEVAARLASASGMDLPRTFLGAHIVPAEYRHRRAEYIDLVILEMLPAFAAAESRPEFFDVFCDPAGFSVEECRRLLAAAQVHGLAIKLHAEQFARIGGVALAVEFNAVSVDHLDAAKGEDGIALAKAPTVATLLPGSNMFLGIPYPPGRVLIDAGAAVALATDFNPGTCPILSMPLIMSLACSGMRLSPAECWTAATINAAAALNRAGVCGSLQPSKRADLALFEVDDYRAVSYFAGSNLCCGVYQAGAWHPGKET